MKLTRQLLRDSLAILYFIIGWKLGGCLLAKHPGECESDRRPNRGAYQFASEAADAPKEPSAETVASGGEGVTASRGEAEDADGHNTAIGVARDTAIDEAAGNEFGGENGVVPFEDAGERPVGYAAQDAE